MRTEEYLKRFFEEKEIKEKIYTVKHGQNLHFIESERIIELIFLTGADEQEKIAGILREIDFRNGDINHFLNHLATAYVQKNY
ncbi:hypothetical protein J7E51_27700 [Priestia megaterium]|nr:hypothetical protein [Priestia megaterium]